MERGESHAQKLQTSKTIEYDLLIRGRAYSSVRRERLEWDGPSRKVDDAFGYILEM
jgi:hypothetical protein